MGDLNEIELVLELQKDGGYHVYAPDLRGLHTQGSDFNDAMANASEAISLYVEGSRENGGSIDMGVVGRRVSLLAWDRPGGDGSADG